MPRGALLQRLGDWARTTWLGRVLLGSVTAFFRLEMFDRSMAIAAQLFTSVLPILIIIATWVSARDERRLEGYLDLPAQTQSVIQDAVDGAGSTTIGLVGFIFVLGSATSLSRALTRAFAAIWSLRKPKSNLRSASRWLAVVLILALAVIVVAVASQRLESVPPPGAWPELLTLATDTILGLWLPWLLLAGAVPLRRLAPGALIFAALMLVVRPATELWFGPALSASSDRYGSMGVAFTYLALLYVIAFCFLASSVTGQVVTTDPGALGKWIREGGAIPQAGAARLDEEP